MYCLINTQYCFFIVLTHTCINCCICSLLQAANAIEKVEGLEQLSRLDSLHLRDNLVGQLDGFSESMAALQYLNIRSVMLYD